MGMLQLSLFDGNENSCILRIRSVWRVPIAKRFLRFFHIFFKLRKHKGGSKPVRVREREGQRERES